MRELTCDALCVCVCVCVCVRVCVRVCVCQPSKFPLLEAMLINHIPRSLAYYPMYFQEAYPLGMWPLVTAAHRTRASSGAAADMHQYKNLFYSTRLPLVGKDELKVNPVDLPSASSRARSCVCVCVSVCECMCMFELCGTFRRCSRIRVTLSCCVVLTSSRLMCSMSSSGVCVRVCVLACVCMRVFTV